MMFGRRHNEILSQRRADAGFTLVELMIALVLGLVVVAGVGSVFLANQNAYRTNVALGAALIVGAGLFTLWRQRQKG